MFYIRTQDQSICITTNFKTLENSTKPLFLKDLRRVWNSFGTCLNCGKQKYDEKNTLLVDDSPHKALCNPVSALILVSCDQLLYTISAISTFLNINIGLIVFFVLFFSYIRESFLSRISTQTVTILHWVSLYFTKYSKLSKFCNIKKQKELIENHSVYLHSVLVKSLMES